MPISSTVQNLLSKVCHLKSKNTLYDIPLEYLNDDEQAAYHAIVGHVRKHNMFPKALSFRKLTGFPLQDTPEAITYYKDEARRRALFTVCANSLRDMQSVIQARDPDKFVEYCRQVVNTERTINPDRYSGVTDIGTALRGVIEDYDIAHMTPGLRGVTTGWDYVDEQTGGYMPGDVITMVARPARGKTMLLLKQAAAARAAGHSVLFVSPEVPQLQLARRYLGIESRVDPDLMRKGTLSNAARRLIEEHAVSLSDGIPMHLVAGRFKKSTPVIRALVEELDPDIVYVDASYLVSPEKKRQGSSGRREVISDVAEEIKDISTETNKSIVQTVQFNRLAKKPSRPPGEGEQIHPLAHLGLDVIGETDVIGQISSIVMGIELYDAPYQKTRRWMGFLKGREGEDGFWAVNYKFRPVDLSLAHVGFANRASGADDDASAPNLDFME